MLILDKKEGLKTRILKKKKPRRREANLTKDKQNEEQKLMKE